MNPINQRLRISSPVLSGLLYAFIWMALGAVALSALLLLGGIRENNLSAYTYIIHGFALFVGGFTAGRRSVRRGWYAGGLIGILYCLIVLLVSFLAYDSGLSFTVFVFFVAAFGVSAIGGIFGVNTRK